MTADFGYFEHDADYGIVGRGPKLEAAFENAAAAMFAIMNTRGETGGDVEVAVEFDEPDPEFALVEWLNRLLAASREENALLTEFSLRRDGARFRGHARGRRWRPGEDRGTEVKGATLTALAVKESASGWEARCVVDV